MRLDFNILWVEDQPDAVKSQFDRIDFLLRKEGFRAQVEFANSVERAKEFLSSDVFGDHIDLILMDYDLGPGKKGDEGLVEARSSFSYKDIVFYSANAPDLLTMVANRRIQGVFCSTREDLPDTVTGVFEALVKKVLDIDHSRGIVLGTTSDIDQFVNDALLAMMEGDTGAKTEQALGIVAKRLADIRARFEEDFAMVSAIKTVQELCEAHHIYTSIDRLNLLRKMLEKNGVYLDFAESLKGYANEAVPRRNVLAHVNVKKEGFSRKLYNRKGEELTSEIMKGLRLTLLNHHELAEELARLLRQK